jgi:hypothetical protein
MEFINKVVLTGDKHTEESTNVGEYKTLRSTSLSQPGLLCSSNHW